MSKEYFCPHHKYVLLPNEKLGYSWSGTRLCQNGSCHTCLILISDKIVRFEFKFDDSVKLIYSYKNHILSYLCPKRQEMINLVMDPNVVDFTMEEMLRAKSKAEKMINFL